MEGAVNVVLTTSTQVEAEALGAWCADCWSTAFTVLTEALAGTIAVPTESELISSLPVKP